MERYIHSRALWIIMESKAITPPCPVSVNWLGWVKTMDDLKRQIRKLNDAELIELRRYLDNWKPSSQPQKLSWVEETFEAECKRLMLGFIHPSTKTLIRKHAQELEQFFDRGCPGSKLITKRAVLAMGLSLVYRDLTERCGLLVTSRMLANHMARIPAALDIAFPGYARFGMLNMIAKRRINISGGV